MKVIITEYAYETHETIFGLEGAAGYSSKNETLAIVDDMNCLYVVNGFVKNNRLHIYPDSQEEPNLVKGQTIIIKEVQKYE